MEKRPGKDELVKLRHTRALEVDLERRDLNLQVSARDQAGLFTLFEDQRHFFLFCSFFGGSPSGVWGATSSSVPGTPSGKCLGNQCVLDLWDIAPCSLFHHFLVCFRGVRGTLLCHCEATQALSEATKT